MTSKKPMSAREVINSVLLKKDAKWYSSGDDSVNDWGLLAQELTAALEAFAREAVKDAEQKCCCNGRNICSCIRDSRAEAFEKAARCAETFFGTKCEGIEALENRIAMRIRYLAKETK